MIKEFVDSFMARKQELREAFATTPPRRYYDIVEGVVTIISDGGYGSPCRDRIHEIDDGEYQGTLVYVIGACGYQPYRYWYVRICYGSCSFCDTLQYIRDLNNEEKPTEEQLNHYVTLALHIVQGIKEMERPML
jgi:hypothetical protein